MSIRNAARRSHVNDVPRSQFAVAVNYRWSINFRVADNPETTPFVDTGAFRSAPIEAEA